MKTNSNKKVLHMFNNTTIKKDTSIKNDLSHNTSIQNDISHNTSIQNDISQKSITCDISLGSAKYISNNERSVLNKQMNN
jgi:hypothetical protein